MTQARHEHGRGVVAVGTAPGVVALGTPAPGVRPVVEHHIDFSTPAPPPPKAPKAPHVPVTEFLADFLE